ncbi:pectinesterase [Puccinia sorghi]|uniref:pectinesterase n=1 Tax=Puccinia sorghi TaxID=27349 RepID=A0A0L6VP02_9BASI|nr:pectinesterase [Puccinia sorghi]
MSHFTWVASLIIIHCTLFVSSNKIFPPRQLPTFTDKHQPTLYQPQSSTLLPSVGSPDSRSQIDGNGEGSPFFNSTKLPNPTIIVNQGTHHPGEFRTIQSAVNSLRNLTGPQVIYVHDGVYREQVYIDYEAPLIIHGRKPPTSGKNFVTVVFSLSAKEAKSNQASATLNVLKDEDVINEFGHTTDNQALALNAQGYRQAFYNCAFKSYQDTVRAYKGVQLFSRCEISGAVDRFPGSMDVALLPIHPKLLLECSITASGRHLNDTAGFFVFNNATVYSAGALAGSAYLGRPWGKGAKVTFQNSNLTDVINPAGWLAWSPNDPRTEKVQFQEYGNYGSGAKENRSYNTPLSSPHLPENILGSNYLNWVDYSYRPILKISQPSTAHTLTTKGDTQPNFAKRPGRQATLKK